MNSGVGRQNIKSLTGRRVSPNAKNEDGDDASMMIAMLSANNGGGPGRG